MTVIELAKLANVTPDAVRYYTRLALINPERHPENNYKLYSAHDVKRVKFIARAQRLGFSLAEINEIIKTSHQGNTPCPLVRETIRTRIEEHKVMLKEMMDLQIRMQNALEKWETMPDQMPDGHAICRLIETIEDL